MKRGLIYLFRYALVVLYTIFWGIPAVLVGLTDRSGEGVIWIGRRWVSWILRACGIRVRAEGLEQVDPHQPYVFMSNHESVIDIAALAATLPVTFRFVAKRELAYIPLFGWAIALGGHVMIDRGNHASAVRSLARAAERIRGGTNVIIFPEGTRSTTGALQPFKKGGFHLAIAAQVPILPVTVSGTRRIAPKRSLRIESGEVKVLYGKPIPTAGLLVEHRDELSARVREVIESGYDSAYQGPRD